MKGPTSSHYLSLPSEAVNLISVFMGLSLLC